jgi:hypothetical protein
MRALITRSRYLSIVVLALASGALMSTAGYAWRTNGWQVAGLVMVPGGLLISLALALLPRNAHQQVTQQPQSSAKRPRLAMAITGRTVGLPTASGGLPVRHGLAVSLLALVAGGAMVGAGYEAAASAWLLAAALVLVGGVVISAALVVAMVGHRHAGFRF